MGYPGGVYHPRAFQFDGPHAQEVVEQSDAVAEQDGHQVHVYLVEQSSPDALLGDAGGAHGDVLVARDRSRLLDGAFDAVRDERERRSLVDPFLRGGMGDDEAGTPKGRLPPHPLVMSNVLRPVTIAPILLCASRRSSALCGKSLNTISVPGSLYSVSPPEYHAKSRSPPSPSGDPGPSLGPATKPSSDIESPVATFPMFGLLPSFPIVWAQHTAKVPEANRRIRNRNSNKDISEYAASRRPGNKTLET
jgi:hypothetical protein